MSDLAYKVGKCLLLEILQSAGMTQTDLATRMDIKVQQINKYVHERQKMSYEVAKNISVILNCRMDDLYEWIEVGDNE